MLSSVELFQLSEMVPNTGHHAAICPLDAERMALARALEDILHIVSYLEGLADGVATQRERVCAARIRAVAATLREVIGAPLPSIGCARSERTMTAEHIQARKKALAKTPAERKTMLLEQAFVTQGPATRHEQVHTEPHSTNSAKKSLPYPTGLTTREVEVLCLVAQGLTDAQVAERLVVSPRTVNWHLTVIYSKIGVPSRSAATRYAIEQQLL